MNKAIFLDRDGTINVDRDYIYKIEDFEFLPNVIESLRILQEAGYILIIVTNQSGIGRGYYTEEDFHKLNDWMLQELIRHNVNISKVYFCPHIPDAQIERYRILCGCRKPNLGMFRQAIKDFDIDIDASYAIGDKIRDCAICEKTGCTGFLIHSNEKPKIIQSVKLGMFKGVYYMPTLFDCVLNIIQKK